VVHADVWIPFVGPQGELPHYGRVCERYDAAHASEAEAPQPASTRAEDAANGSAGVAEHATEDGAAADNAHARKDTADSEGTRTAGEEEDDDGNDEDDDDDVRPPHPLKSPCLCF
jgi:hypothetical protein